MENKQELKKIMFEMLEGKLIGAKSFVTKPENMTNKILTNILVQLCQVVSKPKSRDKTSVNEIKPLIVLCCQPITDLSDAQINNYLRSLFHLIKFLSQHLPFDELTELLEFVNPRKICSNSNSKDLEDLYSHFAVLIHNELIVTNSKTKDLSSLEKCLIESIEIVWFIFKKNPELFFSRVHSYASFLQKYEEQRPLVNFCVKVLKCLKEMSEDDKKKYTKEIYQVCVPIIYFSISNNKNDDKKCEKTIKQIFEYIKIVSVYQEEVAQCYEIYKIFCYVIIRTPFYNKEDATLLKVLNRNINELIKTNTINSNVASTFNYIFKILRLYIEHYEKAEKNQWLETMTEDLQIEFIKMFQNIARIISQLKYSDNCHKNCNIKTNYSHAVITGSIITTFFYNSLRYKFENMQQLHEIAYPCFKDCLKHVEKLKNCNCNRWAPNWRLLGTMAYNIATKFYRNNEYKLAKTYYYLFCQYAFVFEGNENDTKHINNLLGISLYLIGSSYMNLKQYRTALTYLALAIEVDKEICEKVWVTWSNVKSKANHDNIGNISELTIVEVLENDIEDIKLLHPNYKLKSHNFEDLLYEELQYYFKLWSSKIPINKTCLKFLSICKDSIKKTIVINMVWEKILPLQDPTLIETVEELITILSNENKNNLLSQLCLSVLYYIDFQYKMYDVLKKNLSEMNEAQIEEKPEIKPYEEPTNPNDKCDIIPTYYNNKIENLQELHKILNKSIIIWNEILENKKISTIEEHVKKLNIDHYIQQTAYEYRLQNYTYQMIKTWFLYLQFGKLFNNIDVIIEATGFIIEFCGPESETCRHLINKAEKYINEFIKKENYNIGLILTYYINKCTGYLRNKKLKEGYEILETAQNYFKKLNDNDLNKIYKARLLYLESLFLQKPCNLKIMGHGQNYTVLLQNAFAMIAEFYQNGRNKCLYTLSILFEICLTMGWMYKWLRMPREVRCYSSEILLLAQQTVLPLRTTQFLSLLAFTDLLGCQYDDCKVKISGIDYILCYRNTQKATRFNEISENDNINEINDEFKKLSIHKVDQSIEMMLDVPMEHKIKNLQGSPILQSKSFTIPTFLYHINCTCFYCVNIDYQRLILEATHLDALFYLTQSNFVCALEFFKGGLKLYNYLIRKYQSLHDDLELLEQLKKNLVFSYSIFLKDYSFYFAKHKNYDEAKKLVDKIINLLGDELYSNPHFCSEILMHKINLVTAKTYIQTESGKHDLTGEFVEEICLSRTPDNKMSVAKITLSVSPCKDITPKKCLKKISFDIFASDEEKNQKTPEKPKRIFKMKTPGKTPRPKTSVKIYPPAETKNKLENINLDPSPIKVSPCKLEKSPTDFGTKLKSTKVLEQRTKLLTRKLKAEKILKESNTNVICNDSAKEVVNKNNKVQKENVTTSRKGVIKEPANKNTSKIPTIRNMRGKLLNNDISSKEEEDEKKKTVINKRLNQKIVSSSSEDSGRSSRSTRSTRFNNK